MTTIIFNPHRHGKTALIMDTLAQDIRSRLTRIGEDIIGIGQALLQARKVCPRGHWSAWLGELGLPESTARNYMNVAMRFQSATVAGYQQAALYILAAPTTPAPARDAAEQLVADRGPDHPVTSREARVLKDAPDAVRTRYVGGDLSLTQAEGLVQSLRQPLKPVVRQMVEAGRVSDPAVVVMLDRLPDEELEVVAVTGAVHGEASVPLPEVTARDLQRIEEERRREEQRRKQAEQRVTVCLGRKADVVAVDGDCVTIQMSGLAGALTEGDVIFVTIEKNTG